MAQTWDITINGSDYHLTFDKKLTINGETFALSKFKRKTHIKEYEYFIPLGNKTAVLHIFNKKEKEPILVIDHRDCVTGAVYQVEKIPAWAWIFVIPYIFNVLFIIGGAIGGAIAGTFVAISLAIAADKEKSVVSKVLICIAMYVVVTVLSYLIVTAIFSL